MARVMECSSPATLLDPAEKELAVASSWCPYYALQSLAVDRIFPDFVGRAREGLMQQTRQGPFFGRKLRKAINTMLSHLPRAPFLWRLEIRAHSNCQGQFRPQRRIHALPDDLDSVALSCDTRYQRSKGQINF